MIVITADQIDSTHRDDIVGATVEALNSRHGQLLALPVDRNAGDEIQAMTDDPGTALAIILALLRSGAWSVGCGIGGVRHPLADHTREAAGPSFVAARRGVERAKKAPHRFCLVIDGAQPVRDSDISPLIELLLFVRARRTPEGWELFDLLASGMSGVAAAAALGISPQAVSQRAQAAGVRADLAAIAPLTRLMGLANDGPSPAG